MKTLYFRLALLFLLVFVSCKKDIVKVENAGEPLLYQVFFNGELYREYTYTDANLLHEDKSKFFYTKHHYNTNNLVNLSELYEDRRIYSSSWVLAQEAENRTEWVNSANTERAGYNLYEYNDEGQLTKHTNVREWPDYSTTSITTFGYNADNRISRHSYLYEGQISGYDDFLYDDRGNVLKKSRYNVSNGKATLSTTTDYEYDNKKNPYKTFQRLLQPGLYTNTNNIVMETYQLHFEVDSQTEKVQITTATYEYNEQDYPIRKNGSWEYRYK